MFRENIDVVNGVFSVMYLQNESPRSERSLWTWISRSLALSGWWLGWIIFAQPFNIQPIHHKEHKIPSIPNTKHTKHTVVYTMVSCSTYKSIIEHTKNDWKLLLSCFLLFLKRNLYRLHEECETKLFGFGSEIVMEWSAAPTHWGHQIYVTVSCTEFNWKFLWWKLFNQKCSVEEWHILC